MPFDNIKTRMQCVGNRYTGMLECGRDMLEREGVKVFWRATTPRLVRLTVSEASISWHERALTRLSAVQWNHLCRL
jgi:hypothetical protein